MAATLQTTSSKSCSCMGKVVLPFRFNWRLLPRIQLTRTELQMMARCRTTLTSHYLNQWWTSSLVYLWVIGIETMLCWLDWVVMVHTTAGVFQDPVQQTKPLHGRALCTDPPHNSLHQAIIRSLRSIGTNRNPGIQYHTLSPGVNEYVQSIR